MDLGASRTRGMEAAAFGPSRCVGKRGGRERKGRHGHRRGASGGGGTGVLRAERERSEEETRRRHCVFFGGRIGMQNRKPTYIFAGPAPKRSRIAAREAERKPVEDKK